MSCSIFKDMFWTCKSPAPKFDFTFFPWVSNFKILLKFLQKKHKVIEDLSSRCMSDAATHSPGSSNLLSFFNIMVLVASCSHSSWMKWGICIFWEWMVGVLWWPFLIFPSQAMFIVATMLMCLACVWLSLFMCLITFLSWNPASLVDVSSCPQEGRFLHSVRFREAGMDRDAREQVDSEGNGVVGRYVKEWKGGFYREGSKIVKTWATVVECWEQKGRRQSPSMWGICFTVNLNTFQGRRNF